MKATVEISDHSSGCWVPDGALCQAWVEGALAAGSNEKAVTVSLCFVDAGESEQLNRRFRQRRQPSNVLAFPNELAAELPAQSGGAPIGDIAICAELAEQEAHTQGKPVAHHWAHLVIHGCLHLLGYDHISEDEAECMEAMEIGILCKLGIPNPYPVS